MPKKKLLVGTRKGLLTFAEGPGGWTLHQAGHLGIPVVYAMQDHRSSLYYASLEHGHWGPKLHRSTDGSQWEELSTPAYPESSEAALDLIWYIAAGGDDQPKRMYLGTNPGGLFVSDDAGDSFSLNAPLWQHESRKDWFGGGRNTPGIHSVVIDARDSGRVSVAISCGGVFESTDAGESWKPRNQGLAADFLPDPSVEWGQDPHFVTQSPADPNTYWQQNHCGVYRSDDAGNTWHEVSKGFGFPITTHPENADTAWVVPGEGDDKRMAVDGALRVLRTEDRGQTWTPLTKGLPQKLAFDVVYRHALDQDHDRLAFGSTTGNLYFTGDGGEEWFTIGNNLPPIYSVRFCD